MEAIQGVVTAVNGLLWGPPMLVLILGTGLFLTFGLRLMTLRKISYAFRQLFAGRRDVQRCDRPVAVIDTKTTLMWQKTSPSG